MVLESNPSSRRATLQQEGYFPHSMPGKHASSIDASSLPDSDLVSLGDAANFEDRGCFDEDRADGGTTLVVPTGIIGPSKRKHKEKEPNPTPGEGWTKPTGRRAQKLHSRQRAKEKRNRGADFAAWLVSTFGDAELKRPGGVVLDVAGGRGDLAWALTVTHGAPTTVVDPLALRLSAAKTKFILREAAKRLPQKLLCETALEDTAKEDFQPAVQSSIFSMSRGGNSGTNSEADGDEPSNAVSKESARIPKGVSSAAISRHKAAAWDGNARALALAVGDDRASWLDLPTVASQLPLHWSLSTAIAQIKQVLRLFDTPVGPATTSKLGASASGFDQLGIAGKSHDPSEGAGMLGLAQHQCCLEEQYVGSRGAAAQGAEEPAAVAAERAGLRQTWESANVIVGLHPDEVVYFNHYVERLLTYFFS